MIDAREIICSSNAIIYYKGVSRLPRAPYELYIEQLLRAFHAK